MAIEENTPAPLEQSTPTTPDPSSLLSAYSVEKEVITQPTVDTDLPDEPIPPHLDGEKPPVPDGQRVYKTGKKAGQPRPDPKGPRMTYNNQPTTIPASMFVTGAMFLMVIDMVFPMLIVAGNNFVSDVKVKLEQVRITADKERKKEIEPLADATLKQLNIHGNPAAMLAFVMVTNWCWQLFAARALNAPIKKDEKEVKK